MENVNLVSKLKDIEHVFSEGEDAFVPSPGARGGGAGQEVRDHPWQLRGGGGAV